MAEANALGGVEIRSTTLKRARGRVGVKLTCPAVGPRCTGRVALSAVPAPDAVFGRVPRSGRTAFVVRAGRSTVVRVAANRTLTGRLRKAARIPVRVEVERGVTQGDVADLTLRR